MGRAPRSPKAVRTPIDENILPSRVPTTPDGLIAAAQALAIHHYYLLATRPETDIASTNQMPYALWIVGSTRDRTATCAPVGFKGLASLLPARPWLQTPPLLRNIGPLGIGSIH